MNFSICLSGLLILGSKNIDPSKIIFHESDHMRDFFLCVPFCCCCFVSLSAVMSFGWWREVRI